MDEELYFDEYLYLMGSDYYFEYISHVYIAFTKVRRGESLDISQLPIVNCEKMRLCSPLPCEVLMVFRIL